MQAKSVLIFKSSVFYYDCIGRWGKFKNKSLTHDLNVRIQNVSRVGIGKDLQLNKYEQ